MNLRKPGSRRVIAEYSTSALSALQRLAQLKVFWSLKATMFRGTAPIHDSLPPSPSLPPPPLCCCPAKQESASLESHSTVILPVEEPTVQEIDCAYEVPVGGMCRSCASGGSTDGAGL